MREVADDGSWKSPPGKSFAGMKSLKFELEFAVPFVVADVEAVEVWLKM